MSQLHRLFRLAPRLVPATVASLVSLFAIAPAETLLNRLLHAPLPVAAADQGEPAPEIVVITHFGPHENPAMRLQRFAYRPAPQRDAHQQAACAEGTCFDPDAFEPTAGGIMGDDGGQGGPSLASAAMPEGAPPSSPSHEEQFDIVGLDAFADAGNGAGGNRGSGGTTGAGGPGGSGGGGDHGGASFVLLPGAGGTGGDGGSSGTGGDDGSQPPSNREAGSNGAGGGGNNGGGAGGGLVAGGNPGEDEDETVIEKISLRAAPAVGATDVPAPGTAVLLGAALAVLGVRRRTM